MRDGYLQFVSLFTVLTLGCAGATEIGQGTGGSAGMSVAGTSAMAGTGGGLETGGTAGLASGESAGMGAFPPASAGLGGTSAFVPSPDCAASPPDYVDYSTLAELEGLLVRRWRRCIEPQIAGEELGIEFTSDGRIFPLYTDAEGNVQRRTGVDYELTWAYSPPGSPNPSGGQPSETGTIVLGGVYTNPPWFTDDPVQLRILLTPVLARYTPLD